MTKKLEREVGANPLDGYATAIAACIDVATGKSRSRLRLDAAQMLLDHCSEPPWVSWDCEPVDE